LEVVLKKAGRLDTYKRGQARNELLHSFVVLPKLWIVERSFSWLEKMSQIMLKILSLQWLSGTVSINYLPIKFGFICNIALKKPHD
jgi:transposase